MPEDAPVTSAFWPLSLRSIGQVGITTGGSVGSSAGGNVLTSIRLRSLGSPRPSPSGAAQAMRIISRRAAPGK
jgi:hypothetical protein